MINLRTARKLAPTLFTGMVLSGLMAACGGGGSSTALPATSYPAVKATQGDTLTYTQTSTPSSAAATTFLSTRYYKTVNSDGSVSYTNTFATLYSGTTLVFDANGARTSYAGLNNAGNTCTYSPPLKGASAPLSIGQTFNANTIETCVNGSTTTTHDVTLTGTFTALESVTVPAGTFTALKETTTLTSTDKATGVITQTDQTCWIDTVLGRTVKCNSTIKTTPAGSTTSSVASTNTLDLVRYNISGQAGSIPDPAVYAGGWTASYTGTDSGTCSTVTISTAGVISGNCISNTTGAFTIGGSVNAQGAGSFTQGGTSGGATFFGTLNPVTGNGTWSNGTGGSGTWTMAHK